MHANARGARGRAPSSAVSTQSTGKGHAVPAPFFHLAAYVRRVEHGEQIEIRRRNRVVARLVPTEGAVTQPRKDLNWEEVAERCEHMWDGKLAPGKPASEIVYESRGER